MAFTEQAADEANNVGATARAPMADRKSCSPSERRRSLQMQRQTAITIEGDSTESAAVVGSLIPEGDEEVPTSKVDEVDRTGFGSHYILPQLTDQTKLLSSLLTASPRRIRRSVNFSCES